MNNVVLVAYSGKKPSRAEIEKIAEVLEKMRFCNEVELIKHYDQDSVCDIIGKGATLIGFEPKENVALKNAATFVNAHFKSAWDLVGKVAVARQAAFISEDQQALLNAVEIIGSTTQEECAKYGISSIIQNACYNIKYNILNID